MSKVSQKDFNKVMKRLTETVEGYYSKWYTEDEVKELAKVTSEQIVEFNANHTYLCKIENGVTYYSYDFICDIFGAYNRVDISEYLK